MIRAFLGGTGWVLMTAGFMVALAAIIGGWDDCPSGRENPMAPNVVTAVAIGAVAFAVGLAIVAVAG